MRVERLRSKEGFRIGLFSSRKLSQPYQERRWNIRSTGARRRLLVDSRWILAVDETGKVEFAGFLLLAARGARVADLGGGRSGVKEHKGQETEDVFEGLFFHS